MPSDRALSAAGLALSSSLMVYVTVAPDLKDIRATSPGHDLRLAKNLRFSQQWGIGVMILSGAAASWLVKDKLPLWVSLFAAALIAGSYELCYRAEGYGDVEA